MDRVFDTGASASPPAAPASPSTGYPSAGNPSGGIAATKPGPWWYHMVTEELRAVVAAAGLTPDHLALNQLATAIAALSAAGAAPAGTVAYMAMSAAPSGWLKANGATISRTVYAALFTAIGTTFGVGDGSTTFGLPDLRGEFIRNWDDARGVDAGRALGAYQADDFKAHNHAWGTNTAVTPAAGAGGPNFGGGTSPTSASGGTETRPRNIALLACIKY